MRRVSNCMLLALSIGCALVGCDERDLLKTPPPPGVISPEGAVRPLPEVSEPDAPADRSNEGGAERIVGLRTGPMPDFVNWDDDLQPDGLSILVSALDADGRAVPLTGRRLVMTLYTDRGNKLRRRGRAVMQWEAPAEGFDERRTDTLLTGPAIELKLAIDRRLEEGYYALETRLITPDGRHLVTLDPALWLVWRE